MGFKWFRAKVSKRGFTDRLEFPIGWTEPAIKQGPIKCHVLKEKSMYIDAQGHLVPCCWLGARQQNFITDDLATVKLTWKTDTPNPVCAKTCSTNKNKSVFQNQWQREIQLC
jgi:hypothetical protein